MKHGARNVSIWSSTDKKHKVVVIEDSPYDPTNEKIRV